MTKKCTYKVVTACLDGVDALAVVKDKKHRLFQTAQKGRAILRSRLANDSNHIVRNENRLTLSNKLEEKVSGEIFNL